MLGMLKDHVHPTASFSVVITKLDLLGDADADEVASRLVSGTIAEGAQVFATADRPGNGVVRGQGVADLLDHLLPSLASQPTEHVTPAPAPSAILQRFWKGS
jgi:hypothetical protein